MPQTANNSSENTSSLTAEERSPPGAQARTGDSHHHRHHHHHHRHHRHNAHASRQSHRMMSQRPPEQDVRSAPQPTAGVDPAMDTIMNAEGPSMESTTTMHPQTLDAEEQMSFAAEVQGHRHHSHAVHHYHTPHHSRGQEVLDLETTTPEIQPSSADADPASAQGGDDSETTDASRRSEQHLASQATPPAHQHFHRHPGHHHQHNHRRQLNLSHEEGVDNSPPGERHRLLQDQQRQQHFRSNPFNSGLWISIELGFLLTQIVAAIIVLPLSIYEQPKDPLGVWVTGYAAGCAALLPLLYWRYSQWCARDASSSAASGPAVQGDRPTPAAQEEQAVPRAQEGDGEALLDLHQQQSAGAPAAAVAAGLDVDIEAGLNTRGRRAARRLLCFNMDDPRLPVLIAKYKAALDCFFAMWYVLGSMWVLGGTTTFQDAPILYSLSLVYILLSSISYGVPFLLCATICCCLPCIIAVMGSEDIDPARPQGAGLGPGSSKGADPEAIAALPTFVFRTTTNRQRNEQKEGDEEETCDVEGGARKTEQAQGSDLGMGKVLPVSSLVSSDSQGRAPSRGGFLGALTRARWLQGFRGRRVGSQVVAEQEARGKKCAEGADSDDDADSVGSGEEGLLCAGSVEEQKLAGGDAVCCICLAHYRDGAELRKLPCHHHFHAPCVDTWLVINGCCPLCKEPIASGQKEASDP